MESLQTSDQETGWARRDTVCLLLVAVLQGFIVRLKNQKLIVFM